MPPKRTTSVVHASCIQCPSWLRVGFSLLRPRCFESRALRDAHEEDDNRQVQYLENRVPAAPAIEYTGDARLRGVWTYSAGGCDGCYLIGKHGSTMFYYEDGITSRLFGILQEEGGGTDRFLVILSIGTLRIRPSSGKMISQFKPWNSTQNHPDLIANRATRDPARAVSGFPVGSRDRLNTFYSGELGSGSASPSSPGRQRTSESDGTPLDFALAAEKVVEDDDRFDEMFGRVEQASSAWGSAPAEGDDAGGPASGNPRAVDVSGKWELFEKTSGKFIFSLKQNAAGAIKGRGRSCDDPASDWSIEVHGRVEGRKLTWTEYVSKRRGKKPVQEAGRMTAIISPCGRFFGGFGLTDAASASAAQHFAGVLTKSHSPARKPGDPDQVGNRASGKLTLTKWGDDDGGDDKRGSTVGRMGSFVGGAMRRTRSAGKRSSGGGPRDASPRSATPTAGGRSMFSSMVMPRSQSAAGEGRGDKSFPDDASSNASDQSRGPGYKRAKVARGFRKAIGIFGKGDRAQASLTESAGNLSSSMLGSSYRSSQLKASVASAMLR